MESRTLNGRSLSRTCVAAVGASARAIDPDTVYRIAHTRVACIQVGVQSDRYRTRRITLINQIPRSVPTNVLPAERTLCDRTETHSLRRSRDCRKATGQ